MSELLLPLYDAPAVSNGAALILGDTLLLALLVLAGHLLAGRMRSALASQAAASLVVGVAMLTVSGAAVLALSSILNLNLSIYLVPLTLLLLTAVGMRRRRELGPPVAALRSAAVAAPVLLALSALVRLGDTALVFTDTVAMIASSAAFARGHTELLFVEPTTFYSFPPGVKVTHALAFLYDREELSLLATGHGGIRPLGIILLVAAAVLVGSAVRQLTASAGSRWSRLLAAAAPLALVSSSPVVFIAHLNAAHAPVAAALLLLALLLLTSFGAAAPEADSSSATFAGSLLVALVVLHRVEALIIVPLVLLPAFRLAGVDRRRLAVLWQTLGATAAVWYFAALTPYLRSDAGSWQNWAGDPATTLVALMAAGVACYMFGLFSKVLPVRAIRQLPAIAAAGLWAASALYAGLDWEGFAASVGATGQNLFPVGGVEPAGSWIWSGVAFALVAVLVVAGRLRDRRPEVAMFSYPALLFFPAMLLAAFVRDGGYRVGFPDSLNRSWLHMLPLLIIAAAVSTTRRVDHEDSPAEWPAADLGRQRLTGCPTPV